MSDSTHIYQSVSLSPSSQAVPSSSSHLQLIFPFHNISPLVSSTAVAVKHFLKPFRVNGDETHCYAVIICMD
jgi:hypothetical protein